MRTRMLKIMCLGVLCVSFLVFIMSCSSMQNILGWLRSDDSKDEEISRFLSNVRPHPGNPDSHYLLASYYQERGRHKEALEEFKKVLLIDPNCVKAYNGTGVSYDLLGDFSNAIGYYKQALKINPGLDYVHNNLGYSYLLRGNFDEAIAAFKNAIDLNGQNTRFHNNLGLAYGEKGQYDLALAEFKLAGNEAEAHHNLAQIYFKKGLMAEAKHHYAIALKLNPSLTLARTVQKATDALAKIFEPISEKVEPNQLIVPDRPKEVAKVENLKAPEQLTAMEMGPMAGEALPASNQQSMVKEVSSSYNISRQDQEPVIAVEKAKIAEAKEMKKEEARLGEVERVKKAKDIVDVSLEDKNDSITYSIVADGKIGNYDVFQLDSPSRLVLDILKIGNHYPKTGIWIENPFIKVVRIGHHPDKMRFVFDALNPQLPPYQVTRMDPKLTVSFGNVPQPEEPKIYAKEKPSPQKDEAPIAKKTPLKTNHSDELAIEISNGNGVNRMARMVGDYLKGKGFRVTRLTNADYFNYAETRIFYQKEYHEAADQVAEQLPVFRSKEETEKFDRPSIRIKVLIGRDLVPHKKSFENEKKS